MKPIAVRPRKGIRSETAPAEEGNQERDGGDEEHGRRRRAVGALRAQTGGEDAVVGHRDQKPARDHHVADEIGEDRRKGRHADDDGSDPAQGPGRRRERGQRRRAHLPADVRDAGRPAAGVRRGKRGKDHEERVGERRRHDRRDHHPERLPEGEAELAGQVRDRLEPHVKPGGEGDDLEYLRNRRRAVRREGRRRHAQVAATVEHGRTEADRDADGEQDGQDGLHAAREAPPAVDGGGGEDGGSRKQDVPEIDAIARDAVAEAETECVPEQAARDDRERRGVRPDDRHVGQAEKPRAEEAMVDAERPGGERKGAARPGIASGHVMVVPGDDGHDCGADEHADRRTERSRLRQEHGSGHDERAPADGRSKRERPGGERREMSREKRLLHLNPPNNARSESQENLARP